MGGFVRNGQFVLWPPTDPFPDKRIEIDFEGVNGSFTGHTKKATHFGVALIIS